MQISRRTSFLTLVLLIIIEVAQPISDVTDYNSTTSDRKGRVNGRIVKIYSSSKPDPVICVEEGFRADPVDCSVFYRCAKASKGKYNVYRFRCGPGTVYDPETEICNYPSSTKRSECGGLMQTDMRDDDNDIAGQELPSPISTASSLYPSHSESNGIESSSTSHFIEKYPNSKPSTTFSYPLLATTEQKYVEHSNNLPAYQLMDLQNESQNIVVPFTTTAPKLDNSYPCTSDGFVGDNDDCRKFYRCVSNSRGGFIRYEFSCSESTVWDDNMQSCNHAWAVRSNRCGRSDFLNSNNSNSFHQNDGTTPQHKPLQNVSEIKVEEQNYEANDVYDENNSEYGNKLNDKQQPTSNSQEVLVTETQNKFTENQNVENKKPYLETNKLSHYDTTVSSYPLNNVHQNYITQATGNNRSNHCSQSGFMADSNDCKKFYRCVDNGNGGFTKYEFSCSQQTVWDSSIEACNHAWAVKECGGKLLSETSNSAASFIGPINVSTSTFSYVKEENEYDHIHEVNQEQTTYRYPSRLTTVSTVQTTSIENNQNFDYDSGYNSQQNAFTTPHGIGESETTLKNPQFQQNQCQSSGFMGDTNDCKKFYRCVDNGNGGFTQHEFSCGEGTAWDPEIESCNHASAIKDCSAGHILQSTHNVNDVSQKPTNTPGYEVGNEYVTQSNTQPDNLIPSTTLRSSTLITEATNNEYECKSDGFISDKNDCKKFYRCVGDGNGGFIQHEFSCGQGTAWDSKINACNHERAVDNCSNNFGTQLEPSSQSQNETQVSMSSSSPVTQMQQTQTSTLSIKPTTAPLVNNSNSKEYECSSEGFFAHPNDCKKFIRCVDDGNDGYTKYDFSCGDGTIWVQEIESCDHNTDVHCSNIHSIDTTPKHEVSTSTTNLISPNTEKDSEINKPHDKECVSEGFYPNKNDCRNFYRCVDNGDGHFTKYEFSCAEGTAWDVTIGSCNYLSKVNGCEDVQTKPIMQDEQVSESQQDITTSETATVSSTIRPTTLKSTTYMETSSKSTTTRTTTVESTTSIETTSKPTTTKVTTSKSTTEHAKPLSEDVCEEDGYYGNSQDCSKFYRCVSNEKGYYTKYDYTCAEGTIWDQDITACNHPRDVTNPSCKSQQESSSTTTSSSTQHTSAGNGNMSETTLSPISTSTSPSNKNETHSNCSNNSTESSNDHNKNDLPCKKAGFYANPTDCKKFYRCVDWDNNGEKFSIFHFECGEGTIWDPALETCNHENSVYPPRNCNGTQQQSENITDSTSTTENLSSTTSEESTTTTQQPTTQTTIQQSTTKQTTTERSTTQSSTVQESTTQQSTTQQSTTQSSTTQKLTTQQSTTQQSTTQQPTTQQSTTQQSTTQQSPTQQSPTQQSTTEQSITEQSTIQQSTTDKSTTESTQTTSQTTEEQTTKPSTEQTTAVAESNTTASTTQSSDQTTTTDSTTQQLTTTDNTTESSTENQTESSTESMSNKECPDIDKDQYLFVCPTSFKRHPKYCNLFYQCTDDNDSHEVKIAVFQCPNNTIYDESKVQCVEENKTDKKCNGQIAKKYRVKRLGIENNEPIVVTKEKMSCPTTGHFPFSKHEQCSAALLKCELSKSGKLRGYVYRCPEGYVYWSISRRCEPLKKLKDCEKPSEMWNRRYDIPIERHNIGH